MLDVEESSSGHGNYSLEDFLRVTRDYEQEDHWFQMSEELCFVFLFVFFSVMGLVGNGLVCFIIIRKGSKQSSRNWYIFNLAVSDILTCVLCKPFTLVRLVLKNWPLGSVMCQTVPSLQTVYVFVSHADPRGSSCWPLPRCRVQHAVCQPVSPLSSILPASHLGRVRVHRRAHLHRAPTGGG